MSKQRLKRSPIGTVHNNNELANEIISVLDKLSKDNTLSHWQYMSAVAMQEASEELKNLSNLLRDVADWLCSIGYPIDFSSTILPPAKFRSLIEDAWVRRDGPEHSSEIREVVAEEGGWSFNNA